MNIERVQKSLTWAIIASETSHVFCCVLPAIFSVLSVATGLGLIAAMPAGLTAIHEILHHWEVPMIALSGAVVLFGWAVHLMARRLDCHGTGCSHGPCGPKKKRSGVVLKFATALFLVNITVFVVFHHGLEAFVR